MSMPFRPSDTEEPSVTSFDLAQALRNLCKAASDYRDLVVRLGIDGMTAAQATAEGGVNPTEVRARFERTVIAYRATARNCLGATSGTYADEMDLARAQIACLEHNSRNALSTAMRRVDAVEAADAAGMRAAHDRGEDISAALYGTTETAPCADLPRTADAYDYGRSAAANASASHAAYERGFVSPAEA